MDRDAPTDFPRCRRIFAMLDRSDDGRARSRNQSGHRIMFARPLQARLRTITAGLIVFTACTAAAAPEPVKETTLTANSRASLHLTIYNDNLALVQDRRTFAMTKGMQRIGLAGVSRLMMPETALLDTSALKGVRVLEQDFAFDLLTPAKILEYALGRKVLVVRTHPTTGAETTEEGVLLGTTGGVVVRLGNRIETNPPGRLVFTELPPGLRRKPTLLATMTAERPAKGALDLRYLTGGLSWNADYTADYAEDAGKLTLQSWATVTNRTGTDFEDTSLRFVAGQVNRHTRPPTPERMQRLAKASMDVGAPGGGGMTAQAAGDYYLYELPATATIADRQTKQLALLKATTVPVMREYRLRGGAYHYRRFAPTQSLNAETTLIFRNDEKDGLGLPLPAGTVRVYGEAGKGGAIFLGEDRIPHTAKGRKVELGLGRAFDISAKRRQLSFRKQGLAKNTSEAEYEIKIKNAKAKPVTVKLFENMTGDWEVLSESHPHEKKRAFEAVWAITVPANGETVLTYKVRVIR
jgi:hypothetical protein